MQIAFMDHKYKKEKEKKEKSTEHCVMRKIQFIVHSNFKKLCFFSHSLFSHATIICFSVYHLFVCYIYNFTFCSNVYVSHLNSPECMQMQVLNLKMTFDSFHEIHNHLQHQYRTIKL